MENLTLSQELSIETWKSIATKIQQLNLEDYSNETFLKNLMLLRKFLTEENIHTGTLERYPKYPQQIGAASLLQSIYNIKEGIHHKKAAFYENIFALDELGIKTLSFHPIKTSYDMYPFLEQKDSSNRIHKVLTDGIFLLSGSKYINKFQYHMSNIENANYLLEISLEKENESVVLHSSKAIISNFNAINFLPNKEEIVKFCFPKKEILMQDPLDWDDLPTTKQNFQTYDMSNSQFSKYLIKDKEHYYKK